MDYLKKQKDDSNFESPFLLLCLKIRLARESDGAFGRRKSHQFFAVR